MKVAKVTDVVLCVVVAVYIAVAAVSAAVAAPESGACTACLALWTELRHDVGCGNAVNDTGALCKLCPESICGTPAHCQTIVDEVCAAGCADDPDQCAYLACSKLLHICPGSLEEVDVSLAWVQQYRMAKPKQRMAMIGAQTATPDGVMVDLYYYLMAWALKNCAAVDDGCGLAASGCTPMTDAHVSVIFSLFKTTHAYAVTTAISLDATFAYFRDVLLAHAVHAPPHSVDLFDVSQVSAVTQYFIHTYARHYRLYQHVFTPLRVHNIAPRAWGLQTPSIAADIPLADYDRLDEEQVAAMVRARSRSSLHSTVSLASLGDVAEDVISVGSASGGGDGPSGAGATTDATPRGGESGHGSGKASRTSPASRRTRASGSGGGAGSRSPRPSRKAVSRHASAASLKSVGDESGEGEDVVVGSNSGTCDENETHMSEEAVQAELKAIALKAAEAQLAEVKAELDLKMARQDEALLARIAVLEQRMYALSSGEGGSPVQAQERRRRTRT
ncbi:uncharacterized protein AMSG_12240 [Thecamonas trahens ATCC 50062]|uniref:Uncharacterized protein n=1 Tax=Thecamonas trahens ATCC 50062 TaxID=461836 RepID=A0A0L0DL41_THETB|nr:hypothetical protein AMSG_12240 [Thecamonas trahens ATCC 50062]KNC52980.1 hypothetical protein AMSG_12240 [Thecamonas trahens ATCC 50062]|eukprot:XP_013754918.1 hypothetical protein AMSG_12240 [Thecamonas trahens ATCC 50062]